MKATNFNLITAEQVHEHEKYHHGTVFKIAFFQ